MMNGPRNAEQDVLLLKGSHGSRDGERWLSHPSLNDWIKSIHLTESYTEVSSTLLTGHWDLSNSINKIYVTVMDVL